MGIAVGIGFEHMVDVIVMVVGFWVTVTVELASLFASVDPWTKKENNTKLKISEIRIPECTLSIHLYISSVLL